MKFLIARCFLLVIMLALLNYNLFAQTFKIYGTVKDSTGKALIGVNVYIPEIKYGAATDENGQYEINNLPPGSYTIEFSMIGFNSRVFTNQVIQNNPIKLNVLLYEKIIQTDQVIISASKYEQKINELPVSAAIINEQDLARKDYTTLGDALRYVPGLNMVDDQLSIRGSSGYSRGVGSRILVAVDGIPLYTGDTGEIVWELIPVSEIERVEIIKGASSSLYGSSALGGVINVITKRIPSQPVTYVKTNIGIYDKPYYKEWDWSNEYRTFSGLTLSHSNRIGNFGYSAALTRNENMSYKQSGYYTRYTGFIKGTYNFSPSTSLLFFVNSLNQDRGNFIYWKDSHNALIPPDADQGQKVKSGRYMLGLIFNDVLNEKFFLSVKSSYYNSNWNDQTSSKNSSTSNLFREEAQINYTLSSQILLISGIEGTADNVNSNLFGNHYSYSFGIYLQGEFKFDFPLSVTAGFRWDFNKLDAINKTDAFSPRIGFNYKLSKKLIMRSSIGTGFRSPSLAEVFTSTTASGITVKPNTNLKPESNIGFEVGANYSLNKYINIDAAVFQNELYDLIEPGIDPADGLAHFNNVIRARIQGTEINSICNLLANKLKFSINYTYLWAIDIQKKNALRYRPRQQITAGMDYKFHSINLGADFRYWSKVEEMDFELADLGLIKDGRLNSDVYVLDLSAGFDMLKFGMPAKIYFNVNNVLNYNYVELIANLAPIRNYKLTMELVF